MHVLDVCFGIYQLLYLHCRWMYNGLLTRVLTFLLYIVHVDTLYGISFAHNYGKHNLLSLFINMQSY